MSKKIILLLLTISFFYSCSTSKTSKVDNPLYEVLVVNNDGGANIKFFEILTEPNEIVMLQSDETLKKKIKAKDVAESNFVIINSGPTKESYNRVSIQKVIEKPTEIEVYIKDTQKNIDINLSDENTKYPYSIVKINSKKPIVFK